MRVSKQNDFLLLKTHYFFSSAILVCSSLPGIFQNNPVVIHFSLPAQKQLILCDIQNGSVQDLSYTGVAEGLKRKPETPGSRSCIFPVVLPPSFIRIFKMSYYKNTCLLRYKRQCCFENGRVKVLQQSFYITIPAMTKQCQFMCHAWQFMYLS